MIYTNITKKSNKIRVRGLDDNGSRIQYEEMFRPTLFVTSKVETEYKSLHGNHSLEPIQPGTMWDCKVFNDKYGDIEGFDIHGNTQWITQWISDKFEGESLVAPMDKLRIGTIDIETQCDVDFPDPDTVLEEINVITITLNKKTYVLGVGSFKLHNKRFQYETFSSEYEMLKVFLDLWEDLDLDVITGWNINFFDIPYLYNRISKVLGADQARRMSPWKNVAERTASYFGSQRIVYNLNGIAILDYLQLYQKYRLIPRESYKLDHIGEVECNMPKLDWKKDYRSMKEFYTKDFQRFIEYNIIDVDIVAALEDKLKLIELHVSLAYYAKVNFEDVFSQVRTWDAIIYNHLRAKNIIIPPKSNEQKFSMFEGAYVKTPQNGLHEWIVSFDLNSLYPHLIMQYNVSPETLIPGPSMRVSVNELIEQAIDTSSLVKENVCMAANGALFDKSKRGFLPTLMQQMYDERVIAKKKMLACDAEIERIKHEINSRKAKK